MSAATWTVVAAASVALPIVVHGWAYARAAAAKRRARDACPFEDDDHATLPPGRAVQLVVAETLLWWWVVLTAVRRPAGVATPPRGRDATPVVVLTPPGLPHASVRLLVARLRADGVAVVAPRWSPWQRSPEARRRTLDHALRALWEETGAPRVDVVAPAGAAAVVAAHLAAGGSGKPVIGRLFALGAPAPAEPVAPPVEVTALCSYDDPWLGPVERARWPGATTVAIRGYGRLGLLHAPYVYELLREHLLSPAGAPPRSWKSAAS